MTLEACFPATANGLADALRTIDQFRASWNLGADQGARACVIVEELFSNTIKYGYGGDCDRPIRLGLSTEPVFTIIYEDEAEPFNPLRWRPVADLSPADNRRPEGQAGIALVVGLSSSVEYHALPGANRLVATIAPQFPLRP
jgi:anti-sigma regulatory factor (Ser/Thr protein kinase)